jgi:hypothetical protein
MADKAMHMYLGTSKDPMMIVRGGVFGGTLPYIKCAARAYLRAMAETLGDGYLGTEARAYCPHAVMSRSLYLFPGPHLRG